ncbi:MAG: diacylglycerol/lipid kinase family protein, partial [Minisyncoccia bacterium]
IKAFVPAAIKMVDEIGHEMVIENCSLMSFANGKFFGSGMKIAPNAQLDDGLFDVIAVSDLDLKFFLTNGYRVYQGTHIESSNVRQARVRECTVSAVSGGPIYVETDGELFAELPARFSVRHNAILMVR